MGSGAIRKNYQPLFYFHYHTSVASIACCSVVLAYSNKYAAEVDDAGALLKINCLP